jgi:hypothetical protein
MDYPTIEARLHRTRATLNGELAAVGEDFWSRTPRSGGWSVAEVVVHLIQVETAVHKAGVKRLADGPRPLARGLLPRAVWPPIWLIPFRPPAFRRQSPIPMDSVLVAGKAESLARLAARRAETLEFLRATTGAGHNLDSYHWKHPSFGELTFAQWCRVLWYHETRHTKQIREIVRSFQS